MAALRTLQEQGADKETTFQEKVTCPGRGDSRLHMGRAAPTPSAQGAFRRLTSALGWEASRSHMGSWWSSPSGVSSRCSRQGHRLTPEDTRPGPSQLSRVQAEASGFPTSLPMKPLQGFLGLWPPRGGHMQSCSRRCRTSALHTRAALSTLNRLTHSSSREGNSLTRSEKWSPNYNWPDPSDSSIPNSGHHAHNLGATDGHHSPASPGPAGPPGPGHPASAKKWTPHAEEAACVLGSERLGADAGLGLWEAWRVTR